MESTEKRLIESVIAERGFTPDFSEEEKQAAVTAAAAAPDPDDIAARLDYRSHPLITIDGASAHDFDDAVYCRQQPGGTFLLTVAIADVAAYIPAGSVLDKAARERGNSVYLPDRVLPMLPEPLSSDTCSLRPEQDRLSLCCEIEIAADSTVSRYRFFRAVIRSAARLTYDEAAALMEGKANGGSAVAEPLADALHYLHTLAGRLRLQRRQRGAMLLERPAKVCHLKNGELQVTTEHRNVAHWAIEEAMILANCCAADFLIQRQRPALYRTHIRPKSDKIAQLAQILSPLEVALPREPQAADFAAVLDQLARRDNDLVDAMLPFILGTLSRAVYTPDDKIGHYGLACQRYMHFTSPIRRYPDLLTHRALIAAISNHPSPFTAAELTTLGDHCSATEVAADKAGWDIQQRLLCLAAARMVGCDYEGYVSGVAPMGFFVTIAALGIDGMVRLSALPGYWKCNLEKKTVTSPDGAYTVSIGSRVNVRLAAVAAEKGRVDLTLSGNA